MSEMTSDPKVIVALDFYDDAETLSFVSQLDPSLCRLKVATTLFTRFGPTLIEGLERFGFDIFLDLKFFDIPNQVAGACHMAADLGVWMVDCHTSGGLRMLQAAREALDKHPTPPLLIGVTVLTSFDEEDLKQVGVCDSVDDQVRRLASLAVEGGCDGIVCSAKEVATLRPHCPEDFIMVTPGIRLPSDDSHDQRRVMHPADAIALGSSYLVMGRSITQAKDPNAVLANIISQL